MSVVNFAALQSEYNNLYQYSCQLMCNINQLQAVYARCGRGTEGSQIQTQIRNYRKELTKTQNRMRTIQRRMCGLPSRYPRRYGRWY